MIKLTAIKPNAKALDFTRFGPAAKLGMRDAAEGAQADFKATTATWTTGVDFIIKERADGFSVTPTGEGATIYQYVDKGTRAHLIAARRAKRLRFLGGYSAKTRPGFIGAQSGGASGSPVFARVVHHPGTKARGFSKLIAKKWQGRMGQLIGKRIREAM